MAIEHISDTARWVAGYRAPDTDRPDARRSWDKREMKDMWFGPLVGRLYPKRIREEMKRFAGNALLERV